VQEFYNWYAPITLNSRTRAWDLALERRSSVLTRELAQLLRADSAAQAKCKELVGLDFDPFLASQDPASHYEVGAIRQQRERYAWTSTASSPAGAATSLTSVWMSQEQTDTGSSQTSSTLPARTF
jgi:hypothetical protein